MAERFREQIERLDGGTYAQAADQFGVTRATVTYYMALVTRLPDDFVAWLRASEDAELFRCFCERRLRPVTRLDDYRAKVAELRKLVGAAVERGVKGAESAPAVYHTAARPEPRRPK